MTDTEAEARIGRLENRAASETARANAWRDKHRIMAEKRNAAHRAWASENEARREAEARIKAVEGVLDKHETILGDNLGVPVERIRRALDG